MAPQGYDVAEHVLACFGGAGGQHACAIARSLGMRTVFVHKCVRFARSAGGSARQSHKCSSTRCSFGVAHCSATFGAASLRRYASVLSAVGIGIADTVAEAQEARAC